MGFCFTKQKFKDENFKHDSLFKDRLSLDMILEEDDRKAKHTEDTEDLVWCNLGQF